MLLNVAMRAKHGLMRLAEMHDLTLTQLHTLTLIKPGEPLQMNSISSMLFCDASNVTGIVDRLLALGYITREENPHDRRVKHIALTQKGIELQQGVFTETRQVELPGFEKLNESQRETLKLLLTTILE